MTLVAYTSTQYRSQSSYKKATGSKTKQGVVGVTTGDNGVPVAHVPQQGTPYTICGQRAREIVEVEDDQEIRACIVCVRRLNAIQRKQPHLILRLLGPGNPEPALGDH